jgi:hypothetical protein
MKKTIMYEYLGTNGTILSPVHLEDIYYIRKYKLQADNLKKLTKDNEHFVKEVIVPEDEVEEWKEI